jgi:hypothetical protein
VVLLTLAVVEAAPVMASRRTGGSGIVVISCLTNGFGMNSLAKVPYGAFE